MSLDETYRTSNRDARCPLSTFSDEKIMAEIQAGNGDAFAVLFDRFHRLILVTALKIVRDAAEAEEVTQNVFLEIYRAAKQFDPSRGTLRVWLLQFAYHRSINRRNYLVLRQFYDQSDIQEVLDWKCSGGTPPHLTVQESARLAEEALEILNEPQRRTIQLVFFQGMTLKEVAEQTNESLSNIRNHYYRGLDRLRDSFSTQALRPGHDGTIPIREVDRAKA
jgi:RNA polymerase sigma-70 factor, ECF subfamily